MVTGRTENPNCCSRASHGLGTAAGICIVLHGSGWTLQCDWAKARSTLKLPRHAQSFSSSCDHARPHQLSFVLAMLLTVNARRSRQKRDRNTASLGERDLSFKFPTVPNAGATGRQEGRQACYFSTAHPQESRAGTRSKMLGVILRFLIHKPWHNRHHLRIWFGQSTRSTCLSNIQ